MRHILNLFLVALVCGGLLTACSGGGEDHHDHDHHDHDHAHDHDHDHHDHDHGDEAAASASGITIMPVEGSPEFPDAALSLAEPKLGTNVAAGNTHFKFAIDNYKLAVPTESEKAKHCANSAKGQHIHYILNNEPYKAKYEAEFDEELSDGKHLLLAFLSRSYHESIKNGTAYVLQQIDVGESDAEDYDLSQPMLFYSRPKGTYTGADAKNILLDFYAINAELGADYKVKATINGEEFMLDSWQPYVIEGLPMGKNTVRIQLIDKDGNAVPGPFNDSGEREFTLEEAAS